jgi:uncharacterized membrane protein
MEALMHRKSMIVIALSGSLLLSACAPLENDDKYPATGVVLGAVSGFAVGSAISEPVTGALVGGLIGGALGLIYGEYWKDELDLGF